MGHRRLDPADAAARTAERIARAQEQITEAVAAIQSGKQWRDYLLVQSRLHAYSGPNTLLIWTQYARLYEQGLVPTPWPTYVAGFHTWKALGRHVTKGQRGLEILAPHRHTTRLAVDAAGGERPLARGEQPGPGERIESHQAVRGFRLEHAFGYEQTTGAPLAEAPTPTLLHGQAPPGLWDTIAAQIQDCGYQLHLVVSAEELGGANGLTNWESKTVRVRADMDEAPRARTAIHELAHVLLHEPATLRQRPARERRPSRNVLEVEAESVAFIVADAHHLPAGGYSFPYVAGWAGPDGMEVVRATAARVAATARQIITASTADHTTGGRAPGVEQALAARHDHASRPRRYAGPEPPRPGLGFEVAG